MIQPPNLSGDYRQDFPRIKQFFEEVFTDLNFDNMDGEELSGVTATAGDALVINHNLGRVPTRFIPTKQDKVGSVFMSAATVKQVTIKASVNTMAVTFFIQ